LPLLSEPPFAPPLALLEPLALELPVLLAELFELVPEEEAAALLADALGTLSGPSVGGTVTGGGGTTST
jgi:hypothetical protein